MIFDSIDIIYFLISCCFFDFAETIIYITIIDNIWLFTGSASSQFEKVATATASIDGSRAIV